MRTFLIIFILLVFFAFDNQPHDNSPRIVREYHYVDIDESILVMNQRVYLPVLPCSYLPGDTKHVETMAIVHIENPSQTAPLYVLNADFYDGHGNLSQILLKKPIRIEPFEANLLIINQQLLTEQPGQNVIIDWGVRVKGVSPRIFIEMNYLCDTTVTRIKDFGKIISDRDEILDRRPI